jgi:hypothetical protein
MIALQGFGGRTFRPYRVRYHPVRVTIKKIFLLTEERDTLNNLGQGGEVRVMKPVRAKDKGYVCYFKTHLPDPWTKPASLP